MTVGSVLDAAAAAAVASARIPVRDGQLLNRPAEFVDRVVAAIDGTAHGKPALPGGEGEVDEGIVLLSARSPAKALGTCR